MIIFLFRKRQKQKETRREGRKEGEDFRPPIKYDKLSIHIHSSPTNPTERESKRGSSSGGKNLQGQRIGENNQMRITGSLKGEEGLEFNCFCWRKGFSLQKLGMPQDFKAQISSEGSE